MRKRSLAAVVDSPHTNRAITRKEHSALLSAHQRRTWAGDGFVAGQKTFPQRSTHSTDTSRPAQVSVLWDAARQGWAPPGNHVSTPAFLGATRESARRGPTLPLATFQLPEQHPAEGSAGDRTCGPRTHPPLPRVKHRPAVQNLPLFLCSPRAPCSLSSTPRRLATAEQFKGCLRMNQEPHKRP